MIEVRVKLPRGVLTPMMVHFLNSVFEHGSIRRAALSNRITYSTAWLMVQEIEHIIGKPVVQRMAGGKAGGGSKPSDVGLALVRSCCRVETLVNKAAKKELELLSTLAGNSIKKRGK